MYSNYLENLKKSRETIYDDNNYQTLSVNSTSSEETYMLTLNKNGELKLVVNANESSESDYTVDSNVLMMRVITTGQNGYQSLYYLKEDGTIYSVCLDCIASDGMEKTKLDYNYIVEINDFFFSDGLSGSYGPIYIDIEGNIHK